VSETSSRLKVKYSCGPIELNIEEYLHFSIKRICRRGRNWFACICQIFLERLTISLREDRYIPSHNHIKNI